MVWLLPTCAMPKPIDIELCIHTVRGRRVIIASDLARLYGVTVKRLNEQLKRNALRFPDDFAFKISPEEWRQLQVNIRQPNLKSQIATSSLHGGLRKLPWVFTEHGAIQAASILNSNRAINMSVAVVRAFVALRQASHNLKKLDDKLAELVGRLDGHDQQIISIVEAIRQLALADVSRRKKRIGFGG